MTVAQVVNHAKHEADGHGSQHNRDAEKDAKKTAEADGTPQQERHCETEKVLGSNGNHHEKDGELQGVPKGRIVEEHAPVVKRGTAELQSVVGTDVTEAQRQ